MNCQELVLFGRPGQLYKDLNNQMIIRVFRATIRKEKVPEFKRLVQEQSIPWLASTDGMLGYLAGEPLGDDDREFVMVTLWRDMESLKSFVGENWKTPVVTADEAPLVEAMMAHHYQKFDKE